MRFSHRMGSMTQFFTLKVSVKRTCGMQLTLSVASGDVKSKATSTLNPHPRIPKLSAPKYPKLEFERELEHVNPVNINGDCVSNSS